MAGIRVVVTTTIAMVVSAHMTVITIVMTDVARDVRSIATMVTTTISHHVVPVVTRVHARERHPHTVVDTWVDSH